MTIRTIMHDLPVGTDPASAAVRSVFGRGFYDSYCPAAAHPNLMTQFMRLVEEVGEYDECPNQYELADVFIVMAQIAWKTDQPPAELWAGKRTPTKRSLAIYCGEIARHLRKHDFESLHADLLEMAGLAQMFAERMEIDFEAVIIAKLLADDSRGYQHNGNGADLQVNGTKPEPDYTLKIFQQGDRSEPDTLPDTLEAAGYCYRDFS